MADIRLIATDLDGTFLTGARTFPEENRAIVQACRRAGVRLCACTGRNWVEAHDVLYDAGLTGLCILNNGACIMDLESEAVYYARRFEEKAVGSLLRAIVQDSDATFLVSGAFTCHLLKGRENPKVLDVWAWRRKVEPQFAHRLCWHETIEELIAACKDDVQRMNVDLPYLVHAARMRELLGPIAPLEITTSRPYRIEIVPAHAGKARALCVLAKLCGVEQEQVMAIGDGRNDEEMLLWAGLGVAMGNGDETLREMADFVTDTNENAGVAQAIWHVLEQQRPL